jgi:holo-[acyl-carrier protein] synthase
MASGLATGVDLVEVERFARVVERRPRLLERIFTDAERACCAGDADRLAARFAAKEAVFKALGEGWPAVSYRDVEVVSSDRGAPSVHLRRGARALARERNVALSLSHTGGLAMAQVVIAP